MAIHTKGCIIAMLEKIRKDKNINGKMISDIM